MSYSFSVVAATKADAKQKIADSFVNVVANQPSHAADRDAAVAAGGAMVDVEGPGRWAGNPRQYPRLAELAA